MSGAPIILPARHLLNLLIFASIIALIGYFAMDPAALGLLGDHHPQLRLRHHPDHSHRRRRHAGGGVDAELLFRLGGGGHRLHAGKYRPDHHRRAGGLIGRDPVLHHVQGHEPQLHIGDRRRLWRRYRRSQGPGGNAPRQAGLGRRRRLHHEERLQRHHRAGLWHGGGPGPACGARNGRQAEEGRRQGLLRHPSRGGPHARPHECAAGRSQCAL